MPSVVRWQGTRTSPDKMSGNENANVRGPIQTSAPVGQTDQIQIGYGEVERANGKRFLPTHSLTWRKETLSRRSLLLRCGGQHPLSSFLPLHVLFALRRLARSAPRARILAYFLHCHQMTTRVSSPNRNHRAYFCLPTTTTTKPCFDVLPQNIPERRLKPVKIAKFQKNIAKF